MMRSARHAKRVMRQTRMKKRVVALNIVSLIDIFAILVFYLLVNALVVEILPSSNALVLPESVVNETPRTTTVLMVTPQAILVDNKTVMPLDLAREVSKDNVLPDLLRELQGKPRLQVEGAATASEYTIGEVNIMADKSIPYSVLKKVITTCTQARANKISLAVVDKGDNTGVKTP